MFDEPEVDESEAEGAEGGGGGGEGAVVGVTVPGTSSSAPKPLASDSAPDHSAGRTT